MAKNLEDFVHFREKNPFKVGFLMGMRGRGWLCGCGGVNVAVAVPVKL